MNTLIILPILIPLISTVFMLFAWHRIKLQRILSVVFMCALVVVSINLLLAVHDKEIAVLHIADWSAPFGISLVADRLSVIMVLVTSLIGLFVTLYSFVVYGGPCFDYAIKTGEQLMQPSLYINTVLNVMP